MTEHPEQPEYSEHSEHLTQPEQPQPGDHTVADDANDQEFTLTVSSDPPGDLMALFGLSDETLLSAVELTMRAVGVKAPVEVSLLITDDTGIRTLNREYRGRDEATDVLSFPLLDAPLVEAPADQLWQTHDDAPLTEAVAETTGPIDGARPAVVMTHTLGANAAAIEAAEALESLEHLTDADLSGATDDEAGESDGDDDWENEPGDEAALDIEGWPVQLGDIALARETVTRQAQQAGHSVAWECAYLFVHGVLHLVGYDDQTDAGYQTMVALQERILAQLGVSR